MDVCGEHQQLVTDTAVIKRDLKTNTEITHEILTAIKGNGKPGLQTESELNKAAIKRVWWWLGGVSLMLLGMLGGILGWTVRKIIL